MERFYKCAMIVEDSEIEVFLLQYMLGRADFAEEILTFEHGRDALDYLKRCETNPDLVLPEFIFLDLNMPLVNGFQFLEALKALPEKISAYPKIIVMTSSDDLTDKLKVFKYNQVIDYCLKPIQPGVIEYLTPRSSRVA